MLDKLDGALRFQQEALNLRAQRQEILSSNIANADTPGFQARDIDFSSQLKKVMEQGRANGTGVSLSLTSARHIPARRFNRLIWTCCSASQINPRWMAIPLIWTANVLTLPIIA